jgi:SpoVK/Ycf46/Vps4 family AAA+-type ATPase
MIGLESAKEVIHKAVASFKMNRQLQKRGISRDRAAYHMVFTGNPGTAKTTVARLLAEILKDEKVLPAGTITEVGRADLVGPVVGSTALIVKEKFRQARGGILFIDEAYSLCDERKNSFGDEAINTIVQEMENHRDETIVIFAGYPEPMKEFLDRNPGMSSRIAFHVDFEDYSVEELAEITKLILKKKELSITDEAMKKLSNLYKIVCKNSDFGNGRFVRKAIEESEMNLAIRLENTDILSASTDELITIEACDIPPRELLIDEGAESKKKPNRIGFACT